jgi:predicted DsbA family dithiol-disulfide isomerase
MRDTMKIEVSVWSDIACPWCFVGKQRLEEAVRRFNQDVGAPHVEVRWRAFELDGRPVSPSPIPYEERLAIKYGTSIARAQQMIDAMTRAIHEAGGSCDFGKIKVANTFDAHRLIQWAGASDRAGVTAGAQHPLADALMRGYLSGALDMNCQAELVALVDALGLDGRAAAAVLASDQFAQAVRDDERLAQHHSISGVPFFVMGNYGLSGAQEADTLLEVLREVCREWPTEGEISMPAMENSHCSDKGGDV